MHQEAQQKNITLLRKPRGADDFIPPMYISGAEELEMKWDTRIQAWEIVTRAGRAEFRIGRVVDGKVMVTFYVTDNQPADDALSNRAARWMNRLLRRREDLGEWRTATPAIDEPEDTGSGAANLTPFSNGEFQIEMIPDGDSFKVAAPGLAKSLGFAEARDMLRTIPEEEKGSELSPITLVSGEKQHRKITFVTEAGFYRAIGNRQAARVKDEAIRAQVERFQSWVYGEVLPSIRKHGAYMTQPTVEQILNDPDTIIKLATDLKREKERAAELEAPAKSWQTLAAPGGDYSVGGAAKVLSRDPEINIGRDRLFKFMASAGWIFRVQKGRPHWEAAQQKAVDTGRLVHKLSSPFFNERTEEWEQPNPTIRITPKGLQQLHKLLGGSDQSTIFAQPEDVR